MAASCRAVLIAMAAPSCLKINPLFDAYAAWEADEATKQALDLGLDPVEILNAAKEAVKACEEEIAELAGRLAVDGWVEMIGQHRVELISDDTGVPFVSPTKESK